MHGKIEREVGGADDDFVAVVTGNERQKFAEEVAGLVRSFVHLPVGGDEFFSHEVWITFLKVMWRLN